MVCLERAGLSDFSLPSCDAFEDVIAGFVTFFGNIYL